MPSSAPRTKRLPARLCPRPRILFVGINPSLRSAAVGHHFAGPGNPFWRLLHAARLIPDAFTYEDDARLPSHGLALTNIVSRATRAASELTRAEFGTGRARLARLIARVKPQTVAFVGVTVYRAFFGPRVGSGPGAKSQRIGDARVFVLPNPSGLNAAYPGFRDKLLWFKRLERYTDPGVPLALGPGADAGRAGRTNRAPRRPPSRLGPAARHTRPPPWPRPGIPGAKADRAGGPADAL